MASSASCSRFFFGGAGFSIVLAVAGKNTRFEELSLGRFAIFGAIGGALASSFPALLPILGLVSPNVPIGQITLALLGPLCVCVVRSLLRSHSS